MNILATTEAQDIAAVQQAIYDETNAFHARDFDGWCACWVQDDRAQDVFAAQSRGLIVQDGFDNIAKAMRQLMDENPVAEPGGFTKSDFQITVKGDMAWAKNFGTCYVRSDAVYPAPDTYEVRIYERHNGKWLMVYSQVSVLRESRSKKPLIQVDEDAQVIWASNMTLDLVKAHEGLTISGGRLRATHRERDKELRTIISRAAEVRNFFDNGMNGPHGNRAVYPCLLGESKAGGVLHCTVFVRDGTINVSFNDDRMIAKKLEAASEILGLSPAQSRLALEISKGLGLTEAAEALGISINTARTHLSRTYDKAGVNSQSGLVRLLMSMESITR